MLAAFITLLVQIIDLYVLVLIVWTVMSVLISFKIVNSYQPVVQRIMTALDRLCEPALKPIRKLLPDLGGIDISPILLILLLNFIQNSLMSMRF